jgi:methionine-rich copper-binding protein CopC
MAMPPPTELRLKFSEGIEIKFTKVKVTGASKKAIETGPPKLDPATIPS